MPFLSNHPCDSTSFSEFYESDDIRDAFYSKPNTIFKRDYVVGLNREKKACLQAEITKKYNSQKTGRLGYLPVAKWTWYAIRYCELSSPMNLLAGKELCYRKPPNNENVALAWPTVSLKRSKRVKRNNRPGRLRAIAVIMAENKQLERDYTLFSLPVNLYHLVELASAHEETITKTAAQRKVIKREKELQLERKQMEHLRSSKKEFLVEGMA